MSFEIGTASGYLDLLNKIYTFLITNGKAYDPEFVGTGNGKISAWDGTPTSVAETWTILATDPTTFSVTGSTSGVKANATAGTPYDNGLVKFTITAGTTAFVAGDKFLINTCPKWTGLVNETSDMDAGATNVQYAVVRAPGNDGLQQIHMSAACFKYPASDIYNVMLSWHTGFAPTIHNAQGQPGGINESVRTRPYLGLWQADIPYWLVANGQRFVLVAKVGTTYEHGYLGFLRTYLPLADYSFPIFAGGSHTAGYTRRYSDTTAETHAYWRGYQGYTDTVDRHSGLARWYDGSVTGAFSYGWRANSDQMNVYPYTTNSNNYPMCYQRECLDGSYFLWPIIFTPAPSDWAAAATIGELDGVYAVSGFSQSAENTVIQGQLTHVVFPNVFRNQTDQWCAIALN